MVNAKHFLTVTAISFAVKESEQAKILVRVYAIVNAINSMVILVMMIFVAIRDSNAVIKNASVILKTVDNLHQK